ncbi:unnamed protein product [Phytophthora lilii]|uniref:Unnamed protein product n=1 Tax=Phytophthora lilii TaxID=2077276 RepID=A0A9W6THM4_9STRA|nr:unnamed protein product [Phytophthora lilii]
MDEERVVGEYKYSDSGEARKGTKSGLDEDMSHLAKVKEQGLTNTDADADAKNILYEYYRKLYEKGSDPYQFDTDC